MPETSRKPRIALGSDHPGFHIQETIRQFLDNSGGPVVDPGPGPKNRWILPTTERPWKNPHMFF
jgi:ribose 5-phosphate isomerase RpiB